MLLVDGDDGFLELRWVSQVVRLFGSFCRFALLKFGDFGENLVFLNDSSIFNYYWFSGVGINDKEKIERFLGLLK